MNKHIHIGQMFLFPVKESLKAINKIIYVYINDTHLYIGLCV